MKVESQRFLSSLRDLIYQVVAHTAKQFAHFEYKSIIPHKMDCFGVAALAITENLLPCHCKILYSTVTLFAKFLGISTSLPSLTATSSAKTCKTTIIAKNSTI